MIWASGVPSRTDYTGIITQVGRNASAAPHACHAPLRPAGSSAAGPSGRMAQSAKLPRATASHQKSEPAAPASIQPMGRAATPVRATRRSVPGMPPSARGAPSHHTGQPLPANMVAYRDGGPHRTHAAIGMESAATPIAARRIVSTGCMALTGQCPSRALSWAQ